MTCRYLLILAAFLLVSAAAVAQDNTAQWTCTAGGVCINPDNAKRPIAVFTSSIYAYGTCLSSLLPMQPQPCNPAPDSWIDMDMTQFGVDRSATAIFLSGMLLITENYNQIGSTTVGFLCRAPGSSASANNQIGYTDVPRSIFATFCPLVNGVMEFRWHVDQPGANEFFGVNLTLQAWFK